MTAINIFLEKLRPVNESHVFHAPKKMLQLTSGMSVYIIGTGVQVRIGHELVNNSQAGCPFICRIQPWQKVYHTRTQVWFIQCPLWCNLWLDNNSGELENLITVNFVAFSYQTNTLLTFITNTKSLVASFKVCLQTYTWLVCIMRECNGCLLLISESCRRNTRSALLVQPPTKRFKLVSTSWLSSTDSPPNLSETYDSV